LDWLCENWDQPEEEIWETRGGRKDFRHGRVMSWVARAGPFAWRGTGDPEVLDAANLLMPVVGFVAPRDPVWLSTVRRHG
jgi:GH15 family glucan-1,4-alpha-glucosidase